MTWSLTPAGVPRAGANSKPHHFKQKVQTNEGRSENMGFNGKTI